MNIFHFTLNWIFLSWRSKIITNTPYHLHSKSQGHEQLIKWRGYCNIGYPSKDRLQLEFQYRDCLPKNGDFHFKDKTVTNYIHYKVWDEITYPFLNFNGTTVEV